MPALHIDFETRSRVDLRTTGVYVYAEDESTDMWCACYCVGNDPIQLWTPDMPPPDAIVQAVKKNWEFYAHNANFERTIWAKILGPRYGWPTPALDQWRCTMAMALAMSYPAGLADAAIAAGMEDGKDMKGHGLMLRMARPRSIEGDKAIWWDEAERKAALYRYCKQDVETERKLIWHIKPLIPAEQELWQLDQQINDRGIYVDYEFCKSALVVVDATLKMLNTEMQELTDGSVSTTTQTARLKVWLAAQGVETDSLDKHHIDEMLLQPGLSGRVRRVLEIRRAGAAASVKKIKTLLACRSKDGRARGLLQFHAASTGRWGGRRFQPQNIKRPTREDVDAAIAAVSTGDVESVRPLGEPLGVVADCLHGMVRAAPGNILFAADFSNIEGRVVAWLTNETWKIDAFRRFDEGYGHDIYILAYANSFGVRPEVVTKDQRQMGKVMELALGYGGGIVAFQRMASGYGLEVEDDTADDLKIRWRKAHPRVKQYWYDLDAAARYAIDKPGPKGRGVIGRVSMQCGVATYLEGTDIVLSRDDDVLYVRLPSRRTLIYPFPRIEEDPVEKRDQIVYSGVDSYSHKWGPQKTYGGSLFNNVVQGTARDIQAEAMRRLEVRGYQVVLTVHDEIVCEVPAGFGSVEEFEELMTVVPDWAKGLPVAAKAWRGERYRK